MPQGRTVLIALALLSSGIWVGSLVCLALVSTVATRELDPVVRVSLFRSIGRLYGRVGTAALLISIATGLALAGSPSGMDCCHRSRRLAFGLPSSLLPGRGWSRRGR